MGSVPFFVVALVVGAMSQQMPQAQANTTDKVVNLTLPADWVPFRADVLRVSSGDTTRGTFHRRRDGSTAHYLITPGGPAITIHNLATHQTYVKLGDRDWVTRPVDEKALATPLQELKLPRKQVQVIRDAVLGDIYEFANAGAKGVVRLVPSLNAFLMSFHLPNGESHEYLNIHIGDQPDELFVPRPVP